jgi:hypothetical protein
VQFSSRLREEGLLPSMGSVADAYDNSMAESFVSTLKRELIHRHSWPNRQTARTAIFEYIEGFYNTRRRMCMRANSSCLRTVLGANVSRSVSSQRSRYLARDRLLESNARPASRSAMALLSFSATSLRIRPYTYLRLPLTSYCPTHLPSLRR